ncbi:hypothetical protein [Neorhizobium tomejilense]|uniref:hypothetical protein n=1 Tax=Neorhizobium tomejilense TaxID=2093828 RepID=UPI000CF9307E|nr:hypothetical protein [Neorhizobium tomejilense]
MNELLSLAKVLFCLFVPIAVVFIAGSNIPLPGIDPAFIARQSSGSSDLPERLSLLALGLTPILNAFAIGELGRLLFPKRAGPAIVTESTAAWTTILVRLIALGIATLQSYSLAVALQAAGAAKPGAWAFVPVVVISMVAATAVLIWLADRVKLPGLRHGLWLLWVAPFFLDFAENLQPSLDQTRTGAMPLLNWLLNAVYICAAAAAVVAVNLHWLKAIGVNGKNPHDQDMDMLSIFVWPIFLASYAGGYLFITLLLLIPSAWLPLQSTTEVIAILTAAALIPIFVFGYARRHLKEMQVPSEKTSAVFSAAAVVAAVQIVLFLLGVFLGRAANLPVSLNGILLIVMTTTFLAIARRKMPSKEERLVALTNAG